MLKFWGLETNFDNSMIGNLESGIPILEKEHISNGSRNDYSGIKIL